jgi:hypothetical protein
MAFTGAQWAQVFEAGARAVAGRRELGPAEAFAVGCQAMAAACLALDAAGGSDDREQRARDALTAQTRARYPWIHQDEEAAR